MDYPSHTRKLMGFGLGTFLAFILRHRLVNKYVCPHGSEQISIMTFCLFLYLFNLSVVLGVLWRTFLIPSLNLLSVWPKGYRDLTTNKYARRLILFEILNGFFSGLVMTIIWFKVVATSFYGLLCEKVSDYYCDGLRYLFIKDLQRAMLKTPFFDNCRDVIKYTPNLLLVFLTTIVAIILYFWEHKNGPDPPMEFRPSRSPSRPSPPNDPMPAIDPPAPSVSQPSCPPESDPPPAPSVSQPSCPPESDPPPAPSVSQPSCPPESDPPPPALESQTPEMTDFPVCKDCGRRHEPDSKDESGDKDCLQTMVPRSTILRDGWKEWGFMDDSNVQLPTLFPEVISTPSDLEQWFKMNDDREMPVLIPEEQPILRRSARLRATPTRGNAVGRSRRRGRGRK